MGSTGEPERKRRHLNTISPTVKKQPPPPSSDEKKRFGQFNRHGMKLKGGSMVEVCRRDEGPFGSWCRARIISGDGQRYNVQYENLLDVDNKYVVEEVHSKAIRPAPPSTKGLGKWVACDTIEVYDHHSWKIGKIVKVLPSNFFIVKLLESLRERTRHQSNLRPRLSWQDGKWVHAQQRFGQFNRHGMKLKGGSMVEVCRRDEGPFGSWCRARIISGDGQSYNVQYENLLDVDNKSVVEEVHSKAIRPAPPSMKGLGKWVACDTIEVYDHHSWKIGKVSKFYRAISSLSSCWNLFEKGHATSQICGHDYLGRMENGFMPSRIELN